MITKSVRTLIVVLILVVISAFALTAFTPKVAEAPTETVLVKLKIGASPVPHAEILAYIRDNLAAAAGLEIEIVEFTDYVQPNLALNDGQLDANFFQHLPYLVDFNAERSTDLVSVAGIHIEPLGIYSKTLTDLKDVPDGAVVIIPNDATNGGRALNLLAANGLIVLKEGAGYKATVLDIEFNSKHLKITELEAAQLVRALDDASLAVINGNYALEGGLVPAKDALALERAEDNPYVNILAVKSGREQDPAILKLITLLTSPEVKAFIEEKYSGSVLPAFGN
ncbi:MAG: MetQ/NlpA family ABC transporter substrate-binding protein [Anaerolineaceae bacterium]|nr:MetQ/NlpA family ABC transporter substrate-binding protein [Anaerolineaceae bacterium]